MNTFQSSAFTKIEQCIYNFLCLKSIDVYARRKKYFEK
jgi:hypothetical protein